MNYLDSSSRFSTWIRCQIHRCVRVALPEFVVELGASGFVVEPGASGFVVESDAVEFVVELDTGVTAHTPC